MLSLKDWPIRLELKPSHLAKNYYRLLAFACAALLLFSFWFSPWILPIALLLYFHFREIKRRYVSLRHSKSFIALECREGAWALSNVSGSMQHTFQLRASSYNRHFVNLLFESTSKRFALFSETNRVLIFADQVSEEDFRKLIVCLKYGRSDLQALTGA